MYIIYICQYLLDFAFLRLCQSFMFSQAITIEMIPKAKQKKNTTNNVIATAVISPYNTRKKHPIVKMFTV